VTQHGKFKNRSLFFVVILPRGGSRLYQSTGAGTLKTKTSLAYFLHFLKAKTFRSFIFRDLFSRGKMVLRVA
jgi:hypothetical protein